MLQLLGIGIQLSIIMGLLVFIAGTLHEINKKMK